MPVTRLPFTTGLSPSLLSSALAVAVALVASGTTACKGSKSSSASGEAPSRSAEAAADPPPAPSVRDDLSTWRALLDEAARAELDVGGALVDFGSPEQYKYTRGDWHSGFGKSGVDDSGISYAGVDNRNGELTVDLRQPAARVAVRGRSVVAGQKLSVLVDGKFRGTTDVASDWGVAQVTFDPPLEAGRHQVIVQFAKNSGGGPRAELDWLWLARSADGDFPVPLPRVLPIDLSGPKRALPAPSARTYSYYLHVPKGAKLVFDYGSDKQTTFEVGVATDGGKWTSVFSGKGVDDAWHEGVADLSSFAGQAVRLDLRTEGPPSLSGWGEPEIMVAQAPDSTPDAETASKTPKNLVYILIDTNRADAMGPFAGMGRKNGADIETPTYDALAKTSTVFLNAYDAENWTKPSVTTNLTGLYPVTHDTKRDPSVLPKDIKLISQHFKEHGFQTGAFIANGFISDKFGFEKGWDFFRNYIREGRRSSADHVYGDALEWLNQRDPKKPFFLYIQTIDPHVVYRLLTDYTKRYYHGEYKGPLGDEITADEQRDLGNGKLKATEDDLKWLQAMYYGEVTFQDHEMGEFLGELKKLGLDQDTMVLVTNDHGEELGDHGKYGHGHSLYDELLRSPLLMHFPGTFPAEMRTEITETVDIVPTILDAMGLPAMDTDGQSLMPLLDGEPVSRPSYAMSEFLDTKRSIRVGRYKLMISYGDWHELYDIQDDPREQNDLYGKRPIALRLCEVYMGEALAAPSKRERQQLKRSHRKFEAADATIDPKLRKKLEALGYFGG